MSLNNTYVLISDVSCWRKLLVFIIVVIGIYIVPDIANADDKNLAEQWNNLSDLFTNIHEIDDLAIALSGPFQNAIWNGVGRLLFFLFLLSMGYSMLGMSLGYDINPVRSMIALTIIMALNTPYTVNRPTGQLPTAIQSMADSGNVSSNTVTTSFGYYYIMQIAKTALNTVIGSVYNDLNRSTQEGRSYKGVPLWLFSELQRSYGEVISEAPQFQLAFSDYNKWCLTNALKVAADTNTNVSMTEWRQAGFFGEWKLGDKGSCSGNLPGNVDTILSQTYTTEGNIQPAYGLGYRVDNGNTDPNGKFIPVIVKLGNDKNNDGYVYSSDALRSYKIPTQHFWYMKLSGGNPPKEDPISAEPMMLDATTRTPGTCISDGYRYDLNSGDNFHAPNCKQLYEVLETGFVNFHRAHGRLYAYKHNLSQSIGDGENPGWYNLIKPGFFFDLAYDTISNTATSKMYQAMLSNTKYGTAMYALNNDGTVDETPLNSLISDPASRYSFNTMRANWNSVGHRLDSFFERFKLDIDVPLAIGFVAILLVLTGIIFPAVTIFAVLPGRLSTVVLYIKVIAYLHIVLGLMYLSLKIGGVCAEAIFMMSANFTDVGVPFNRTVAMIGGTLEFGIYMALASSFVLSYFLIQGTEAGLRSFSGSLPRTTSDNTTANVKAIATTVMAAFGGAKLLGALRGGAAAVGGASTTTKTVTAERISTSPGGAVSGSRATYSEKTSSGNAGGSGGGPSATNVAMIAKQIDDLFKGSSKRR